MAPDQFGRFPLIAKLIDANENLSLQVHPPSDYAQLKENDEGKIEAWYIIDADEEAQVIRGVLPNVGPEDLIDAVREDRPLDVLNAVSVSAGDVVLIPPGIVHSIGGGVLFYEIQKNSDVTYRLYDWNRLTPEGKSRPLHHEKALDVIDFEAMGRTRARPTEVEGPGDKREVLVRTTEFTLNKIQTSDEIEETNQESSFEILTIVEGSGQFRCGKNDGIQFGYGRGDFYLIPAGLNRYRVQPDSETVFLKAEP